MTEPTGPSAERRTSARHRTLFTGVLVHRPEGLTTDCAVRDLSDTGVQVRVFGPLYLAAPIMLLIPKLEKAWEATVAWKRELAIGLYFLREIDLRSAPTSEPENTVRRIWRERAGR